MIGAVILTFFNLFYLVSQNPGYVPLSKTVNLSELYKNPSDDICAECKIIRPPRARHCYYCKRCTFRYDHHCQWVNNCIGIKNNNMFLLFLLNIIFLCGIVDFIAIDVYVSPEHDGFISQKAALAVSAFIVLISLVLLYPIAILFGIQVNNFLKNTTSSERFSKKNPNFKAAKASVKNCMRMCCEK